MNSEITQLELELLREQQLVFMPQKVKIRRRTFTGDNEVGFATIEENVRARITPGFGFWRTVADRFQGITAFTVTLPWNTDVQASDAIIDEEERVFEVRDVKAPSTFHTAAQALCDRVTD